MLRNYLLIAFRNLWYNKFYSLINILGLAIGLTAALFIFQYVQFEKSFDTFHEKGNHIYRLILHIQDNNSGIQQPPAHKSPVALAPIAQNECPEVLKSARMLRDAEAYNVITFYPEDSAAARAYHEDKVYYVDASFMEMFSFPMLSGDPATLQAPNTILLSEALAQKIFGKQWQSANPVGKTIAMKGSRAHTEDESREFVVQGVFEDVPENSHIQFEALASYQTLASEDDRYNDEWWWPFPAYLLLDPQADVDVVEDKLKEITLKYAGDQYSLYDFSFDFTLQPLQATHLYSSNFVEESEVRGNYATVQFLFIAGGFILILAWINYINMSTARAVKRSKEVGIRKVSGAGRWQLATQFLLEAFLINLLSLVVALTLYQICYPFINSLVQKEMPLGSLMSSPWFLTSIALALIAGTLLSGGYLAFVLSSLKAVHTLKGKFHNSSGGILLRKGLIIFQFVVSVGLIIGNVTIFRQLHFMRNFDMGYDISQKLILRSPPNPDQNGLLDERYQSFKNTLLQLPDISHVTASSLLPGGSLIGAAIGVDDNRKNSLSFPLNIIDEDYLNTYELELKHGRWFSNKFPADKDAIVITEDIALALGFDPAESVLEEVLWVNGIEKNVRVIGIVNTFNLRSLTVKEEQGAFFMLKQGREVQSWPVYRKYSHYTIELSHTNQLQEVLAQIQEVYQDHFPGNPFNYFFLDDYFNEQYRAEEQYGKIFTAASGLAIFIACLGLLGLSSFMIKQRTKEIGIRKVLGAQVQSILLLLSSDYFKLIGIAGLIALPIAYWSLHRWLESYMYHITLSWWLFLIPVALVLLIALIIVSVQTIRAALANPARSLKYE